MLDGAKLLAADVLKETFNKLRQHRDAQVNTLTCIHACMHVLSIILMVIYMGL